MWRNIMRMNLFSRDGGRRSRLMAGGMLTLVLCLALSSPVLSATDTGGDAAEGSGDTVAILQQRVSEDIVGSRDAVEAELKDFLLGSADVAQMPVRFRCAAPGCSTMRCARSRIRPSCDATAAPPTDRNRRCR